MDSSWLEESDPHGNTTTLSYLSVTPETSMPGVRSQTLCRSSAEPQPLSEGAWLAQAYSSLTLAHGPLQPLPQHQHPPAPGGPDHRLSLSQAVETGKDMKGEQGIGECSIQTSPCLCPSTIVTVKENKTTYPLFVPLN